MQATERPSSPPTGRIVFGVEGWRVVYQLVGLISALCGALVLRFATDPRPALPASGAPASPSLWPETMAIFRLRTFQVIILQGIVGSMYPPPPPPLSSSYHHGQCQNTAMSALQDNHAHIWYLCA